MTFASFTYIAFFLVVLIILGLTNCNFIGNILGNKVSILRHVILLIASYFFYGFWNWKLCFLMLLVSVMAYAAGIFNKNKTVVIFTIIANLVVLGIFKYYNFFVDSFYKVFNIATRGDLEIVLPVGISFYTFQSISYIIDAYREKIEPEKSFIKVALYISFFPQLVAGPIVKASDFLPQLNQNRNVSLKNIEAGIQIFIFGMFKKIVLADNLSVYVDEVYKAPNAYSSLTILLAIISYAMQIYFDFSGYSDMAIGSAKCLGYDLTKNFNIPYISQNVSEFWKRWHISLSTWLQEYLYIPLGGNRKGDIRTYINLLITMLLGGLWHGASWTFVIWGGLHGLALCAHKYYVKKIGKSISKNIITKVSSVLLTFCFVSICWVFFRADNFSSAFTVLIRLFTLKKGITHIYTWTFISMFLMVVCSVKAYILSDNKNLVEGYYAIKDLNKISSLVYLFVAIGLTIGLAYTGSSPFIYFQF